MATSPDPSKKMEEGSGTLGTGPVEATGPVWPVVPESMSATKLKPVLFVPSNAASVVPATWNERIVPIGSALDAPFPQIPASQVMPKLKLPVPSPLKLPVSAIRCVPAAVWSTEIEARLGAPLNLKYCVSAAPVNRNWFVPISDTRILTFAPACVSVTVPKGAGPQPPEQWSVVSKNESACNEGACSIIPTMRSSATSVHRNMPVFETIDLL